MFLKFKVSDIWVHQDMLVHKVRDSSIMNNKLYFGDNPTGATSGAGTAYHSGSPEFTPGF